MRHHEREEPATGRGEGDGGGGDGEGTGEQHGTGRGVAVGALAQFLDGETRLGGGGPPLRGEGWRSGGRKVGRHWRRRRVVRRRGGSRRLFLLLALVAEPHANFLGEKVQLCGNRFDGLSVWPRVLAEELVQCGLGLRGKHGSLLALPGRHHRSVRPTLHHRVGEFGLLEPLLQDLLDGGSIGGTQLHLLETTDGTLCKVTVAFLCQRLTD